MKEKGYLELVKEAFLEKDCAIRKCAKVRHTYYEIGLWLNKGYPISEIGKAEKKYFAERFLGGTKEKLDKMDRATITEAYKKLGYAVEATQKRSLGLIEKMNQTTVDAGLKGINSAKLEIFLDWLTFYYETKHDYLGFEEREYGAEVRVFFDESNRNQFIDELKIVTKQNRIISLLDVARIAKYRTKYSKKI